jgi:flagellar biosynthesis protein FlhA
LALHSDPDSGAEGDKIDGLPTPSRPSESPPFGSRPMAAMRAKLCSRQEAKKVLDRVNEHDSKVVEDLVPKVLSLAVVQKVLQNPLRELVSLRDAVSIVETLGEAAPITEYVRPAIRRQVVKPSLEPSRDLSGYFLDPALDQSVESGVEHTEIPVT